MDGRYAQAIYNFHTQEPGEINLNAGDIILVTRQVDDNWLCGKSAGNKTGNFPRSFVQLLNLPQCSPGQKLFVATETFPAQTHGDLGFRRGDIIHGIAQVDANWWNGKLGSQSGIFPVTHVKELPSQDDQASSSAPPHARSNGVSDTNSYQVKARANMDLTAQLEEELSFHVGDIIYVTETLDEDFAIGELNGQVGMFPLAFVDIIEGNLNLDAGHSGSLKREKCNRDYKSDIDLRKVRSLSQSSQDYEHTPPQPVVTVQKPAEMTSYEHQMNSQNTAHTNAHFPSFREKPKHVKRTGSLPRSCDLEVTPYGRTLFPFIAENDNELTFFDNEIITLIHHIDDQWIEGEIDGKTGLFPASFVEIVVDCPYLDEAPVVEEETQNSVQQTPDPQIQVSYETEGSPVVEYEETYGLVLYDFKAETARDLDLKEGDTVTVLRKIDENWYEARHDNGHEGLCPTNFIELITVDEVPPPLPTQPPPDVAPQMAPPSPVTPVPECVKKNVPVGQVTAEPPVPQLPQTPVAHQKTNGSIPHAAEIVEESGQEVQVNKKPPKPLLKPKPALKPKPDLKPKPTLPAKPSIPPRTNIPSRATPSPVTAPGDGKAVSPKPQSPAPLLQRAFSTDISGNLDDIVKQELKVAKDEATSRIRASSMSSTPSETSETVGIRVPKEGDRLSVSSSESGDSEVRSVLQDAEVSCQNNEHVLTTGVTMGKSTFYGTEDPSKLKVAAAPPRPVPMTKPPGPPPPLQRQAAGFTKQPAPPRPQGPRPPPAPSKTPLVPTKVTADTKPVPRRPAPPRPPQTSSHLTPQRAPPRPPTSPIMKKAPGDLIGLTPDMSSSSADLPETDNVEVETDSVDVEVVVDLEKRISQIQQDLECCSKKKKELEQLLIEVGDDSSEEIEEDLQFYQANIEGLTAELEGLKASLNQLQPGRALAEAEEQRRAEEKRKLEEERKRRQEEDQRLREEMRQKRRETREKVIGEIKKTEEDFWASLQRTMNVFWAPDVERPEGMDYDALFGNIEEVAEVSQKLLSSLEKGIKDKDFDEQIVGKSFVQLAEDMKSVYAPYCRNHDEVIALLEKYEEVPEIQDFFNGLLDVMRQEVTVFDMGSLLIKPVQRVLKYPLLLNELIKATEESHPDKVELLSAINAMTDVATTINEFKRRKDLVLKYRKEQETKMSDKISKLTLHSLKKKTSRLGQRLSTNLGINVQTKDQEFNREEAKYKNLDKAVRALVKDISVYLEQIQETVACQESVANDIADYYGDQKGKQEVEKFCEVHSKVASQHFRKFRERVEEQVVSPLNKLLLMFCGPDKVIKKRHDKLLDYDSIRLKNLKDNDQVKASKEDMQMAKNNYEALNAQLLDELPKLYALVVDVLHDCVGRFVWAQKQYLSVVLEETYKLLELSIILGAGESNVIEAFNIAHVNAVEKLSDLSFIPKTFNPRVDERKEKKVKRPSTGSDVKTQTQRADSIDSGQQSDSQKMYVRQLYCAEKLYTVMYDYTASQMMDLSLGAGCLVGVIKEGDPMGNKERWFVDNGANKGFIPKKYLMPGTSPQKLEKPAAEVALGPGSSLELLGLSDSPTPGGLDNNLQPAGFTAAQPQQPTAFDPLDPYADLRKTVEAGYEPQFLTANLQPERQPTACWYGSEDLSPVQPSSSQWYSPLHASSEASQLQTNLQSAMENEYNEVQVGGGDEGASQEPQDLPPEYSEYNPEQPPVQGQFFQAVYAFSARSPIEVSMMEGQMVLVLQQHDLDGNSEWWLVDVDGKQGYAPAAYLYRVE